MKIIEVIFLETSSEKVLARADVHFDEFLLKGFKVLRSEKTNKEYVTAPSYKAGIYWRPLFKTDSLEDWQQIQERILKEFNEKEIRESLEENK